MRIIIAIAMAWLAVMFVAQQVQDIKQLRDEQEDSEDLG